MKKAIILILILSILAACIFSACTRKEVAETPPDININQLGYNPADKKIAVLRGEGLTDEFRVIDANTGNVVYSSVLSKPLYSKASDETNRLADFSSVSTEGEYYIENDAAGKSYTFTIGNDVYGNAFEKVIKMFYLQRCGERLSVFSAGRFHHSACHTELATVYETGEQLDVSGGWHDAGDYGRYVVAGAKSVTDLMLAYKRNPAKFTEKDNLLGEIRYELEWMMKMQRSDGGVYHKVTGKDFPDFVMPQKEKDMLVTPVSTTATADFAGSMALASVIYRNTDSDFADKCLEKAILSWSFLDEHKEFIYKNIDEIKTGEYGDYSDIDERYFAASALFYATGEKKYLEAVGKLAENEISQELGWMSMGAYGSYLILTSDNAESLNKELYNKILNTFSGEAKRLAELSETDCYSVSLDEKGYVWGSNMNIANNAMLMLMMNDISPDESYTASAKRHLDYIFGVNPMGTSYVTGTGTASPKHPHHRPSIYKNTAMEGMLVGGPDSYLEDDCAKQELLNKAPAKCYIDNELSYSTNEITIYWNSPLVFLMTEFL